MRVRRVIDSAPRAEGRYVLYWMTMYRRAGWNFALERAVRCAERLQRPLVVLEALRCDYLHASIGLNAHRSAGLLNPPGFQGGYAEAFYATPLPQYREQFTSYRAN